MTDKVWRLPATARTMPLPDGSDVLLLGGDGQPPLLISDGGDREQRLRERRRAEADERTKAMLDQIEHDRFIREHTPVPPLVPIDPLERLRREWERDDWFADVEAARARPSLAELEAWASKTLADEAVRQALQPPEPPEPPAPTRYGRPLSSAQLAYEAAQLRELHERNRQAAKAVCQSCRVYGGDCGRHG